MAEPAGNYFRGSQTSPYHLSVGAVVLDENNQLLCHYFRRGAARGVDDFYILIRETLHPDETLEAAICRGLKEESGIEATILTFLGSVESWFVMRDKTRIEKTTCYFLMRKIGGELSLRQTEDPESDSELCWMEIKDLAHKMRTQFKRLNLPDLDESEILKRAEKYLRLESQRR